MAAKKTKTEKGSDPQQVVEFLNQLDHPLKKEIQEVRTIVLKANDHLTEHIKWNAPSFCFQGEDRITFNFKGNDSFRLIFHCGVKVKTGKAEGRLVDDTTGLLNWVADDRAVARFTDRQDVQEKEAALTTVVNRWLEASRDERE